MNPLLISTIVAGYDTWPYLGLIDPYGTIIEDNWLVTGFAQYLSKAHLINTWKPDMTL